MRHHGRSLIAALSIVLFCSAPPSALADGQADRIAYLDAKYQEWLEEVAVLLSKAERQEFLALDKDYQRDGFIRKFWEARNPYPGTSFNSFKAQWERRVADVREQYGNITEDRAMMKLLHGEPASVYRTNCDLVLWREEIWLYHIGQNVPGEMYLLFYQFNDSGTFHLWHQGDGPAALIAMRVPGTMQQNPSMLDFYGFVHKWCLGDDNVIIRAVEEVVREDGSHLLDGMMAAPRSRDPEWLASFRGVSTDLVPGAPQLSATAEVRFPAHDKARTVVQGVVLVPAAAATPVDLQGNRAYNFMLTGELLRNNELVESFRYRFDLPAASPPGGKGGRADQGDKAGKGDKGDKGGTLPLAFERTAWPGSYVLIVRVEDLHSHAQFRDERPIEVPSVEGLPDLAAPHSSPEVAAVLEAARAEAGPAQSGAAAAGAPGAGDVRGAGAGGPGDIAIRLVPPAGELQTGNVRLEARTGGEGIRKVTFYLDGKSMLTRVRAPYTVELSLGDTPATHEVRVAALAEDGRELASDSLVLNAPKQRFAVRLVEPRAGGQYKAQVMARAEVTVPDGGRLDRLEVFLDDQRLATLYQRPFAQVVPLDAARRGARTVRAVAYLADGSTAEDLAIFNSPDVVEKIDVRLVEVYAAVQDRNGRPLSGLQPGDFKLLDCGQPQSLLRFEHVEDLPLRLLLALDTSASMKDILPQVQAAALAFLTRTLTPRDRAALLTFSDSPTLRLPFSDDLGAMGSVLAGLNAERSTALFDSVVYGLSYMRGAEHAQSALILFTDGGDHVSKLSFDEMLRFARRSGIAVYAIGAGVSHLALSDRNHLAKLAEETGGQSYFIESAKELDGVYTAIAQELRSRYLLAYQPAGPACEGDFRPVEVKVGTAGARVKAMRGYYLR